MPAFPQRLDHLRVRGRPGIAARRAGPMTTVGRLPEEALGHHGATAVRDADEQHVHTVTVCGRTSSATRSSTPGVSE